MHRQDQPMGRGVHDGRPSPECELVVRRLPDRPALVPRHRPVQPVRAWFPSDTAGPVRARRTPLATISRTHARVGVDPWMANHWPAPDDPVALGLAYLPTVLLQRGYRRPGPTGSARPGSAEMLENGVQHGAHLRELACSGRCWATAKQSSITVGHDQARPNWGRAVDHARGIYEQVGASIAGPTPERAQAVSQMATVSEGISDRCRRRCTSIRPKAIAVGHNDLAVVALDGWLSSAPSMVCSNMMPRSRLRAATLPEKSASMPLAAADRRPSGSAGTD
jgi:hypothetical protein